MSTTERLALGALGVSMFLFVGSAIMYLRTPDLPPPPPAPTDVPVITISHDDGWVTNVLCMVGRDPKKISTGRNLGVADCPHDQLGLNQYQK